MLNRRKRENGLICPVCGLARANARGFYFVRYSNINNVALAKFAVRPPLALLAATTAKGIITAVHFFFSFPARPPDAEQSGQVEGVNLAIVVHVSGASGAGSPTAQQNGQVHRTHHPVAVEVT